MIFGKILGGLFGFLLGKAIGLGFFGLIFGIWLGHQFDKSVLKLFKEGLGNLPFSTFHFNSSTQAIQSDFFRNTFLVMGHIAKSDGHVSKREIQAAEAVMQQMRLSPNMRRQAIEYFQQGKRPDFDLQQTLSQFKRQFGGSRLMFSLFIEIQLQAAYAEGQLSSEKRAKLQAVCTALGLGADIFAGINSRFGAEQQYNQYYRQYQNRGGQSPRQRSYKSTLSQAYQVLGVAHDISDDDLKKAYRKLINQHHPDKLAAKGLPNSMIKIATEKTQTIKAAYEQIRDARRSGV